MNLNNIGGPSAGLAFTLGIIDSLTGGNLTGGRTISATGTICADGSVGQVGGVPQKTVAVENAHASVFLVPQAEKSQAEGKATSSLHVFGVTNLAQALQDLRASAESSAPRSRVPRPVREVTVFPQMPQPSLAVSDADAVLMLIVVSDPGEALSRCPWRSAAGVVGSG